MLLRSAESGHACTPSFAQWAVIVCSNCASPISPEKEFSCRIHQSTLSLCSTLRLNPTKSTLNKVEQVTRRRRPPMPPSACGQVRAPHFPEQAR